MGIEAENEESKEDTLNPNVVTEEEKHIPTNSEASTNATSQNLESKEETKELNSISKDISKSEEKSIKSKCSTQDHSNENGAGLHKAQSKKAPKKMRKIKKRIQEEEQNLDKDEENQSEDSDSSSQEDENEITAEKRSKEGKEAQSIKPINESQSESEKNPS
uniref:Uncharacterized protein n=1 Tax=Euplotes crassus TaxID=5936 RepID=A0A7S3KCF1_EUPCR|mmetsp:Transcript_17074/g.16769  ORF Transcript_17074/g.16769 Transcript_17074/m.16769 type:complete len:162 (+) Transcript_17074:739-1224(+)|eukprot:CAMPEP_0197019116 /NCGR_PEP_ID=MMETSP1380-20130617/80504_1 /TAXON_ID=5936 /ORGANISM="Euplotes crassus, Strain CT5" /LENGTH=161 /DNA_ID=CAMNT_0042446465 /DNA_START=537 /DNA_END=1022 /DNA_ORIENTATION=-